MLILYTIYLISKRIFVSNFSNLLCIFHTPKRVTAAAFSSSRYAVQKNKPETTAYLPSYLSRFAIIFQETDAAPALLQR